MTSAIVPLDGSWEAEVALPHARTLAGPDGWLVLVCSVWRGEPPAPRRYLDDRARRLAGGPIESRVVPDCRPSEAILEVAEQLPDALVCMAAHGRSGVAAAVLGSTAEAVVREIERPMLLVGPHAAYAADRMAAANLLIAVDTPLTADVLVPTATAFAARHRLHPWVVEAIPPAPYPFVADSAVPARLGQARGLAHAVELLTSDGHPADSKVVVANDPAGGIVDFARALPASYLVMGTHARSGFARVALGSVAMRAVHHSPCPVLVVRP